MPEPTKTVAAAKSPTWKDFEGRLVQVLGRMAVDQYLIISSRATAGADSHFVQFAQGGREGFRAEAVSNRFLKGTGALSPLQEEQLGDLGWQWPSPTSTSDPNFTREWPMPTPFAEVARLAVRSLREVYRVQRTSWLTYKSFTRDGHNFAQPGLGIDADQPSKPRVDGQTTTPTLDQLRPLVQDAIKAFLNGAEIQYDKDGDIPIRMGSAVVFVRAVDGQPPSVNVFSPVLWDVKETSELLAAANDINTRIRYGRVMWTGREIMAAMEVSAVHITADNIAFACLQVGSIADHFDDELRKRFGGKTMFEETRILVN